jgi:hypothetical protein
MKHLLIAAVVLVPAIAFGQVHKCQVDGKVIYSEAPCPPGTGGAIDIRENSVDTGAIRQQAGRQPPPAAPRKPKFGEQPDPCGYLHTWKGAPTAEQGNAYLACQKRERANKVP